MERFFRSIWHGKSEQSQSENVPSELATIVLEIGSSWESTRTLSIADQARVIVAAGVNMVYASWGILPAEGANGIGINPCHFPAPRKLVISFDNRRTSKVDRYHLNFDEIASAEELNWKNDILPFLTGSKHPKVHEIITYYNTLPKICTLAGNTENEKPGIVIDAARSLRFLFAYVASKGDLGSVIPAHFRISLPIPPELRGQYECDILQIGSFTFHPDFPK